MTPSTPTTAAGRGEGEEEARLLQQGIDVAQRVLAQKRQERDADWMQTFAEQRAQRWLRVKDDWEAWSDSREARLTRTTLDAISQDQETFAAGWDHGFVSAKDRLQRGVDHMRDMLEDEHDLRLEAETRLQQVDDMLENLQLNISADAREGDDYPHILYREIAAIRAALARQPQEHNREP